MKKLTIKQFNLLVKIADHHKFEWFVLRHNDEFNADYVYDWENEEIVSLKDGILMLDDGLVMVDMDYLTEKELASYKRLVKRAKKSN